MPAGGESTAGDAPGAGARSRAVSGAGTGYARSRAKADEVRAGLKPLAPGERPLAVTLAALLAAALAVANVVLYLAGWEVDGEQPSVSGLLVFCAILGAAAIGMWRARYWAVLGFQMLLAISILLASLYLLRASNWEAVAFCVGVLAICGPLFWFLIRAMARLQMPSRTR